MMSPIRREGEIEINFEIVVSATTATAEDNRSLCKRSWRAGWATIYTRFRRQGILLFRFVERTPKDNDDMAGCRRAA